MESVATKVIVTTTPGSTATQVHHRDFSEIRAEGGDVREAATHLLHHLTRALDSALTDWRRESISQAIADVNAFISSQGS
jgi:hypothetical protein